MNLPLCVDPNHNPDGFEALSKLVAATRHCGALAVAITPTIADGESGPFIFVDVPAWVGDGGIEEFDALVKQSTAQRFMTILDQFARLPISYSSNHKVYEIVSAVGNFGSDTNRPYWIVIMIGPRPDSIQAYLGHSVASIGTAELRDTTARLLSS